MIAQKELCRRLDYNPNTGVFIWKFNPDFGVVWNKRYAGTVAGCSREEKSYWLITIDRKKYYAHRLAWLFVYGYYPKYIDHINRIKYDNRIKNLRECTPKNNSMNIGLSKNNKSGMKGVHWNKDRRKWHVQIHKNGRNSYVGLFTDLIEAGKAYNEAAVEEFEKEYVYLNQYQEPDLEKYFET